MRISSAGVRRRRSNLRHADHPRSALRKLHTGASGPMCPGSGGQSTASAVAAAAPTGGEGCAQRQLPRVRLRRPRRREATCRTSSLLRCGAPLIVCFAQQMIGTDSLIGDAALPFRVRQACRNGNQLRLH